MSNVAFDWLTSWFYAPDVPTFGKKNVFDE